MDEFYETSYTNVHRGVYALSERATAAYEGAREKARAFVNAPSAREIIFLRNATEAINLVAYSWGLNNLGPGDLVIVTELEHHSNYVPWQYMAKQDGRGLPHAPAGRQRRGAAGRAGRGRRRRQRQGRRLEPRLELAGDDQRRRHARRLGARAGRDLRVRRGAGRAAPPRRRAGARRRLRRRLRPQDVRPERDRLPVGTGGAARADGAVPDGRAHDPEGRVRADDLGRAAAQVRGRIGAVRGGRRARRCDRLPRGDRARRDRGLRARARRVRARAAGRGARHRPVRPARRPPRRHRQLQRRRASIRTTSRRSWTWTRSRSAPAITAASR